MGASRNLFQSPPDRKYSPRGHLVTNAKELLDKAERALASAQVLLDIGDADIRLVADYTGDEVDGATAAWAVSEASRFVAQMRGLILLDLGKGESDSTYWSLSL